MQREREKKQRYEMIIQTKEADYGVVVGRFQVPCLHSAHLDLLEGVNTKHQKMLVLLGVPAVQGDANNPLDYATRETMIKEKFPNCLVYPLKDIPGDDQAWSSELDAAVKFVFPFGTALLYGGRDSFIPHYKGSIDCAEVVTVASMSGTELRAQAGKKHPVDESGRAGAIYALENQYAHGISTVDIAVIDRRRNSILLGKKANQPKFRLFGGFFDPKKDICLEHAASRELHEEAGMLETSRPQYVMSRVVDDPRYRESKHCIITSLFLCYYSFGTPKAGDDIAEVRWFDIGQQLVGQVMQEHIPLIEALLKGDYHE